MCSQIVIKLRQCIIKIKSHVMSIAKVQSVIPVRLRLVRCHQIKKRHHIWLLWKVFADLEKVFSLKWRCPPWEAAGSQREELRPWQRSWGRRLRHMQRWDRASGNPVPKHLPPKPESAYFTALCSHLYLWLYGRLSPTSFGEGVNLQLQLIKIPRRDKGVSGQTSLLADQLVWQDYPHSCY